MVPFAARGGSDRVARTVAQKLGEALGQPVILEIDQVAKAPPDGSPILMGVAGPIAVNRSLFGNLPSDPPRDFVPIAIVMAAHGDPVGAGMVATLAHPGGNVTGLSSMSEEIDAKRLI